MTKLDVRFDAHWVNRAFLRIFARPVVSLDGTEHIQSWTTPATHEVDPGRVDVRVFIRYRGTRAELGATRRTFDVHDGQHLRLVARNGWANHMPFDIYQEGQV